MIKSSETGLIRSFVASLQSTNIINGPAIAMHLYMVNTHKNSAYGVSTHSKRNSDPVSGFQQRVNTSNYDESMLYCTEIKSASASSNQSCD